MYLKKGVAVLISAACIVGSTIPAYAEAQSIGYNQLESTALQSNVDVKILRLQEERAEDDYVKAKAISFSLENYFDEDDQKTYDDIVNIELTPISEEKDYLDKMYEVLQTENELKLEASNLFYSYFNLEEDLRSKKDYYDFMDEKASSKEKELELGTITQLAYDEFDKSYKQAFLDYLKAKNALDMKMKEINVFLGQDPLTDVELTKVSLPAVDLSVINLDEIEALILENSYQVDALEKSKVIKETEWTLKQRYKGFGDVAIEMALLQDEITELSAKIEDMKRTLKYDLYSLYNTALIAQEDIKLKELEYDLAKRTYDIDELKYENGLISLVDLSESRRSFEASYYSVNDSKLSLYLEMESLLNFIGENTVMISVE